MRTKRVEKFKRCRRRKGRNYILFGIVLPSISILIGYLVTLLVILPVMGK